MGMLQGAADSTAAGSVAKQIQAAAELKPCTLHRQSAQKIGAAAAHLGVRRPAAAHELTHSASVNTAQRVPRHCGWDCGVKQAPKLACYVLLRYHPVLDTAA